jgi:hypothetical protein
MTPNVSSDKGKVEVANSPSACITGGVISTRQNLTAHPMDYTAMGTSAIVSSRFWFLCVLSIIHRPRLSAPTIAREYHALYFPRAFTDIITLAENQILHSDS